MSFTFSSHSTISPSSSSSITTLFNSAYPLSAMCRSQGFLAASPTNGWADNAGQNKGGLRGASCLGTARQFGDHARAPVCRAPQTTGFKCAAAPNANEGQADASNDVDGAEVAAMAIGNKDVMLVSGSPIVIVEAPVMLKTAEPMPMMRPNNGVIKPGDAGRVIDRKPKGLWAVRFAVGAYLIERKCFKPLDIP